MIKQYCIIYEVTVENYEPIEGLYTSLRNYTKTVAKTINLPAPNIVEAIHYAIHKLNVPYEDITEVFEV